MFRYLEGWSGGLSNFEDIKGLYESLLIMPTDLVVAQSQITKVMFLYTP